MTLKRPKNRFQRLLFIVLGMGFILAAYFLFFYFFSFKNVGSRIEPSATVNPPLGATSYYNDIKTGSSPVAVPSEPTLIFGSFFDTFSSSAGINLSKTNLYHDETAAAVFYAPDYSWQPAAATPFSAADNLPAFNNFTGPYTDRRCLAADCLKQTGNELSYNGQALALPAGIKAADIAAVSLGSLTKRWLIGFTLHDGDKYRGEVFYFDGATFTPLLTPAPILSSYFGLFGFGGEEDDFLVIYGAYEGIAYHVQGEAVTDISKFFSIRVMQENGFKAEVIRTAAGSNINWYVFSATLNRPEFIKLWQNRTPEIVGETIFTNFFTAGDESAFFKLTAAKADRIILAAKIKNNNAYSEYVFTDRGFKNNRPGVLVFNPIAHDGATSSGAIKKIAASRLDLDAGSAPLAKFLFSADGQKWQVIPAGQNVDFLTPAVKQFFLQVTWPAFADKFYSPFLEAVLFDYYCRK